MRPMRLSELWIHPIKSCGGLRVPSVSLDRRGLVPDRRWMVVDEAGNRVVLIYGRP